MGYRFNRSVLGGTFDKFHKGHKELIDAAFKASKRVTIGVATETLLKNKEFSKNIESYNTRLTSVRSYLESKRWILRAEFIELDDIFGPSLPDKSIDAIFVTEDTLGNAEIINRKRIEIGFKPLEIVVIPLVNADDGGVISSLRIRKGAIDRNGLSYYHLFAKQKKFILPDVLKTELKKPFGKILKNPKSFKKLVRNPTMVIAIGDIVAINLMEHGIKPDISVIDYRTMRREISDEQKNKIMKLGGFENALTAANFPGSIERRAVGIIKKALNNYLESKSKQTVLIKGEEDLLTIPAVLMSPLDSVLLYGQPNQGMVVIKVTEKKKKEFVHILRSFS